jgi:DNA polymerase V
MSVKILKQTPSLTFFVPDAETGEGLPFVAGGIKAGFPSPAADFEEDKISLDQMVVKHKEATFYARVKGSSMTEAGINDGDILVIDRSLEPHDNKVAICYIDGEFTVKRIKKDKDCVWLMPENLNFPPIKVTEENELIIWGIVTHVLKTL